MIVFRASTLAGPAAPLLLAVVLIAPATAQEQEPGGWARFGGPDQNFQRPAGDLEDAPLGWPEAGPKIRWKAEVGPGHAGVVVLGERVVTAYRRGDDDIVAAFDRASGRRLWSHAESAPFRDFMEPTYGPGPHSTPVIADGSVYAVGSTGRLVALDARSGDRRWTVQLWDELGGTQVERGYAASPLVLGDLVLVPVGGRERSIVAFEGASGKVRWARHNFRAAYASPIAARVGGALQAVLLMEDDLVGVDPASGDLLWSHPVESERYAICTTPIALAAGGFLVVSGDGAERVDVERGEAGFIATRRWVSRRLGCQEHNAALWGDRVIGASGTTTLTTLDASTGRAGFRVRQCEDANIIVVGDQLIAVSARGTLELANLGSRGVEVLGSAQVLGGRCWSAPALDQGVLFARDERQLLAIVATDPAGGD